MIKNFLKLAALFALTMSGVTAVSAEIKEKEFSDAMARYLTTSEGEATVGKAVEKYFQKRQEEMQKQRAESEKKEFEDQFKNPVHIDIGASPVKGPADARITIIEFSDFQCPYCKRGADTIEEVLKAYPKDVKVAFKNLPLPFHKEATPSAKAALAAGK